MCEKWRLWRACAFALARLSFRCSHTWQLSKSQCIGPYDVYLDTLTDVGMLWRMVIQLWANFPYIYIPGCYIFTSLSIVRKMLNKPHHDCFACCFYCKEASSGDWHWHNAFFLELKATSKYGCHQEFPQKLQDGFGGLVGKQKWLKINTLKFPRTPDNSAFFGILSKVYIVGTVLLYIYISKYWYWDGPWYTQSRI